MKNITMNEYCEQYANQKDVKNLKGAAILAYICTVLNIGVYLMLDLDYYPILNTVLLIVCGLGIQFKKSRICSTILLIYALINFVAAITQGSIAGYWWVAAGGFAVYYSFRLHKAYQKFLVSDDAVAE